MYVSAPSAGGCGCLSARETLEPGLCLLSPKMCHKDARSSFCFSPTSPADKSSMYSGWETSAGTWGLSVSSSWIEDTCREKGTALFLPRVAGSESLSLVWAEICFVGALPEYMICLSSSVGTVNSNQLGKNRVFRPVVLQLQTKFQEDTGYHTRGTWSRWRTDQESEGSWVEWPMHETAGLVVLHTTAVAG